MADKLEIVIEQEEKRESVRYGRQENYGETVRQKEAIAIEVEEDFTSERTTSSNKSRNGKRVTKKYKKQSKNTRYKRANKKNSSRSFSCIAF